MAFQIFCKAVCHFHYGKAQYLAIHMLHAAQPHGAMKIQKTAMSIMLIQNIAMLMTILMLVTVVA